MLGVSALNPMTDENIRLFIAKSTWMFAKTMPATPHEYTQRKRAQSDDEFVEFVKHIRAFGYDERFFSKTYRYFDFDGWQYWTMGFDLPTTIIINRAKLNREEHPKSP
jgi:hypothetical protein